jgi:hypothetical protein
VSTEPAPTTVVALGASNLTRGFATVVNAARRVWGEPIDVMAATGIGRSYGIHSRILFRRLPSILECGLWRQLGATPRGRVQALVTDIGNDILYGVEPETVLLWVGQCVTQLHAAGASIAITDLPLHSIRRLTEARYLAFRSILFPACELSLAETLVRCEALNAGILEMARATDLRLVQLRPEWYGLDPIHVRPRLWQRAWQEILLGTADAPSALRPNTQPTRSISALRLFFAAPQQQWLLGIERARTQPVIQTETGTRVWLY